MILGGGELCVGMLVKAYKRDRVDCKVMKRNGWARLGRESWNKFPAEVVTFDDRLGRLRLGVNGAVIFRRRRYKVVLR